jgi:glycosyltransferase involved in cell wall biosynthesis
MNYNYEIITNRQVLKYLALAFEIARDKNAYCVFVALSGYYKPLLFLLAALLRRKIIYFNDGFPKDYLAKKTVLRKILLNLIFKYSYKISIMGRGGLQRLASFGCPKNKLANIPYYIQIPPLTNGAVKDRTILKARGYNISDEDFVVIASGRYEHIKGFDAIIEAANIVVNEKSLKRVKLVIIGDGKDRRILEDLINKYKLSENIFLTGWIQEDEINRFYQAADIFAHMARWEPFGVVVLEAMANGLPVIGTEETMAAIDRVKEGENGFIIKPEDFRSLAEKIIYIYDNEQLLKNMSVSARETALEWPVDRGINDLINILK